MGQDTGGDCIYMKMDAKYWHTGDNAQGYYELLWKHVT